MIFQINLLTAVMNDAPVLPDEDDEVERKISVNAGKSQIYVYL